MRDLAVLFLHLLTTVSLCSANITSGPNEVLLRGLKA